MSFDYTSGDPDNLIGGDDASMTDIQGPFYDIRTYLNSGVLAEIGKGLLVVGEVRFIAVPTAPALWLACDGAAVSRSSYSALFSAIGTVYGAGDGVNTFNVPDLRGRTAVGVGQATGGGVETSPPTRVIGTKWGVNAVVLSAAQSGVNGSMQAGFPSNPYTDYAGGGNVFMGSGGPGSQYNVYKMTANAVSVTPRPADASHENAMPSLAIPAYIYAAA